jgi:hypothetical protein
MINVSTVLEVCPSEVCRILTFHFLLEIFAGQVLVKVNFRMSIVARLINIMLPHKFDSSSIDLQYSCSLKISAMLTYIILVTGRVLQVQDLNQLR